MTGKSARRAGAECSTGSRPPTGRRQLLSVWLRVRLPRGSRIWMAHA